MKTAKKRGHRYPWAAWLAALPVELVRDRDFFGRADTFAQQVYRVAAAADIRITVQLSDDGDVVRIERRNGG